MQERAANNHCDVLVIGGGPAGTTAATLLARQGWQVTILEKDHHPRFHIGESLLPANLDLLRRLGVAEQTAAIGLEKHAAEFVSPAHGGRMQRFEFCNAWEKTMPFAWQVKRAEFDKVLIDNAVKNKVRVIEGCKVGKVAFADDHATIAATHDDGTAAFWTARFVLDASGRDAFLANRMQSKFRNPRHNSSSLYAHFRGAERYPGQAEGNTTIYWFAHGWFWFIPLSGGLTSVGAVVWPHYLKTRGSRDKKQFLLDTIAQCPPLAERLKAAEIATDVEATGNFSYASSRSHGARYLLVGDAYAFIDPVFSSGVLLAMRGGEFAAQALDTALRHPERREAAFARYERQLQHGPKIFSWFIYRMTTPTMRDLFMGPKNPLRMEEALVGMLAGDIYDKPWRFWMAIKAFQLVYWCSALANPRRSWRAWKKRQQDIVPVLDAEIDAVQAAAPQGNA